MALNTRGSFTLDLSLFGSLVEDTIATDLPPGASPDNSDCFYLPGGLFTRPAIVPVLGTPISGNPVITSIKDFPVATGDSYTIFLDGNGALWFNDAVDPTVTTQIDTLSAGVRFKAENFGGKQWYAFYDPDLSSAFTDNLFVGVDIPRYFNGTSVQRVTSDAPGVSPIMGNIDTSPVAATLVGGVYLTRSGNYVTAYIGNTLPSYFVPGYWVSVLGSGSITPNTSNVVQTTQGYVINGAGTVVNMTFPSPVTAGNTMVMSISDFDYFGNIASVVDNLGNTWVSDTLGTFGEWETQFYHALVATSGICTVTITAAGVKFNSAIVAVAAEMTGILTPVAVDGANHNGANSAPASTGSITTTNAADVIFSGIGSGQGNNPNTPPAGFTLVNNFQTPASGYYGGYGLSQAMAFKNVTAVTTINPSWPDGFDGVGTTVAYKLGSAAPPEANGEQINGPNWAINSMSRDTTGLVTVTLGVQLVNLPVGTQLFIQPPPATSFTGTAQVTVGSTTVDRITGANFIATMVGQNIIINSVGYTVASVSSVSALTITSPYVGTSGTYSFGVSINSFPAQFVTVYQVISASGGTTVFTFTSLNTTPALLVGGVAYQVWSPNFGVYGNAAQIISEGHDGNGYFIKYFQLGPDTTYALSIPQLQVQAQAAAGPRQAVLSFESADGAITAPSVPVTFASIGGTNLIYATYVAVGPPTTAKRILSFTPAEGSNYYYIEPTIQSAGDQPPVVAVGTIIFNNTDTTFVTDFSDIQLTNGVQIDAPGNNLFDQVVLAPCLGVIEYDGRLGWFGEINNIKNAINMGFQGGYVYAGSPPAFPKPAGWDLSGGDGAGYLVVTTTQTEQHFSYYMPAGYNSMIQQPVFNDYYGAPVIEPGELYTFRFQAKLDAAGTGNIIAELYSVSAGSLATATFPLSAMSHTATTWQTQTFTLATPAVVPADAKFRFYASSTTTGVTTGELEIIYASFPVSFDQIRWSYYQNPFGYDDISGVNSVDPSESLAGAFRQRGYIYILSDQSLFQSINNGTGEPATWNVIQYVGTCGCSGPNAVDFGEEVAYWGGRYGGRAFSGDPAAKKITQELAETWETIFWNYQTTCWVKNDPVQRIIHWGIPTGTAHSPNLDLAMSYRLSDSAFNIPDPIHVSPYSGKIICTDLGRRWSPWQISANAADMCTRPSPTNSGLAKQVVFAGGGTTGYGNLYTFDTVNYPPLNEDAATWNCIDADYGQIFSYYTTYFFYPHDIEQQPLLSLHRKIFNYVAVHATGIGVLSVTPIIDALKNEQVTMPSPLLRLVDPGFDLEWHPITKGNRVAYRVEPKPSNLVGTIVQSFSTQVLSVSTHAFPFPNPVMSGDQLVILVGTDEYASNPSSITDNQGNVWTFQHHFTGGGDSHGFTLYTATASASGTLSVTVTIGGTSDMAVLAAEITGVGPFDQLLANLGDSASWPSSPLTTTVTNELLISFDMGYAPPVVATDNFTVLQSQILTRSGFGTVQMQMASLPALTVGTYTSSWSMASSSEWKTIIMSYPPSQAAAMAVTHFIVSGHKDLVFPVRSTVFGFNG